MVETVTANKAHFISNTGYQGGRQEASEEEEEVGRLSGSDRKWNSGPLFKNEIYVVSLSFLFSLER
jgi:hypothetical protein